MHVFDSKITMGGAQQMTLKRGDKTKEGIKDRMEKKQKKNKPQNIITLQPDIHRQNLWISPLFSQSYNITSNIFPR